jgi:hypothetical protein
MLQTGGIIFVLQIQQVLNGITISKLLEEDNAHFSEIEISKTDFEKAKIDENEFYFKNELYDIKSITKKGSRYKIIAIKDSEETNILERFKKVFEGNKNPKNKTSDFLVKLLSLVFVVPKSDPTIFFKLTIKNSYITITENTKDKAIAVPTPPPLYS